jgi:hypothetical protein
MRPEDRSNYDYLADGIGVSMNVIDFIEVWWLSLQVVLEPTGVVGRFERSRGDRLNPSCSLSLHRNELQADLVVWESGEAELSVVETDGSTKQHHFEDIRKQPSLRVVLLRLVALASDVRSK